MIILRPPHDGIPVWDHIKCQSLPNRFAKAFRLAWSRTGSISRRVAVERTPGGEKAMEGMPNSAPQNVNQSELFGA